MIRLIVRTEDAGKAANVGGNVDCWYRTFDIEHAELERELSATGAYISTALIGAEVLAITQAKEPT